MAGPSGLNHFAVCWAVCEWCVCVCVCVCVCGGGGGAEVSQSQLSVRPTAYNGSLLPPWRPPHCEH